MNAEKIQAIADAILYEGYMLYPYRPSAVKNRYRWNFGVLHPRELAGEKEPWSAHAEALVEGDETAEIEVQVRFLHLLERETAALPDDSEHAGGSVAPPLSAFQTVEAWQEATDRSFTLHPLKLAKLHRPFGAPFEFPGSREVEYRREENGSISGVTVRTQRAVSGCVEVRCQTAGERLYRVAVTLQNFTSLGDHPPLDRDAIMLRSLVSAHLVLGVKYGQFVSLLDPPEQFRDAAAACRSRGLYPVMAGEEGERNMMLCSPIILYDYPKVAPESPGNLFDNTEIDELLTLRVATLTDAEKQEVRESDDRARELLERSERVARERLGTLHGVIRKAGPDKK